MFHADPWNRYILLGKFSIKRKYSKVLTSIETVGFEYFSTVSNTRVGSRMSYSSIKWRFFCSKICSKVLRSTRVSVSYKRSTIFCNFFAGESFNVQSQRARDERSDRLLHSQHPFPICCLTRILQDIALSRNKRTVDRMRKQGDCERSGKLSAWIATICRLSNRWIDAIRCYDNLPLKALMTESLVKRWFVAE